MFGRRDEFLTFLKTRVHDLEKQLETQQAAHTAREAKLLEHILALTKGPHLAVPTPNLSTPVDLDNPDLPPEFFSGSLPVPKGWLPPDFPLREEPEEPKKPEN